MTVLDDRRTDPGVDDRAGYVPRLHRRHEIVTTGGVAGALCAGQALAACGYPVRELAVDVREGVPYSSLTCTVSLTGPESTIFADRLKGCPSVIAVEPC